MNCLCVFSVCYMSYSNIKCSQYLEYFTSLYLEKVFISIMYYRYYCLLLLWGVWMSLSKGSLCHLSSLLTQNFLIVILDLLDQVETLQFL